MIVRVIIEGHLALAKKGVRIVDLDMNKEKMNILIGRNGFGKTTLLDQITSPLPPDNADYEQDGRKEWWYQDDRGTFILKSKTGKNSEHEFIHNGVNLNQGNTLLVQRELCKIHFGITPAIQAVLSGLDVRDLFTTLSAARRREFLMAANPNDTTYALKVHDKLKANLNTLKGGLRTQRKRLVEEQARMSQMASMSEEVLQAEISQMDEQLKTALYLHGQLHGVEYTELEPLKTKINTIISKLLAGNHRIKHPASHYRQHGESLLVQLAHANGMNQRLGAILAEITTQLQGLDMAEGNLDGCKDRLAMLEESIIQYEVEEQEMSMFFMQHDYFNRDQFYRSPAIIDNGHELISQLQLVHICRDADITGEKYRQAEEKLVHIKNEYNSIQQEISTTQHQLNHFKKAEAVECPDCNTNFKLGFEKFNPASAQKKLDTLVERSETFSAEIKRIEGYVEANQDWYHSMAALVRYLRRLPDYEQLLDLINEYKVGKRDTMVLIECIRRSVSVDLITKQVAQFKEEEKHVRAQVKFLESSDVAALFQRAEDVERELAVTQNRLGRLKLEIQDNEDCLGTIQEDGFLRDQLAEAIEEIQELLEANGKWRLKSKVEEAIAEISPRKDQAVSNLIRAKSLIGVIDSMKENIADMERREKHTQLLLDGLSPLTGLIGSLMNDFLKAVIGNINAIIQPVWSGRLVVLNCETGKGDDGSVDLNYQFPVISGDSNKPTKDISKCSGGEREIINWAFRLTILRYRGKHCPIPLVMDEVGVNFDSLHRRMFCAYVDEQIRLDKINQLVMVSHYIDQFGTFQNANVIALNTEGLSIGRQTNQKSTIK